MTIFLILGAVAALYLIWFLFRLAAFALPIYAGVSLGLFMHASGYGYPASIISGLAAGAALLLLAQLLIAFSPLLRWPIILLFIVPAAFAGHQTAAGIARQAVEPGIWLSALSWVGRSGSGDRSLARPREPSRRWVCLQAAAGPASRSHGWGALSAFVSPGIAIACRKGLSRFAAEHRSADLRSDSIPWA